MSHSLNRKRKSRQGTRVSKASEVIETRPSPALSRRLALIGGISLALSSGGVWAAQFGSPAWFAAQRGGIAAPNAQPAAPGAASNNLSGRVVTPDQALVRAQRSIQNLSRAAQIIASAQAAQNAARQLALTEASNVPNGLQAGGLQVAAGVGTDPSLWQNAQLPVQTVTNGETTVTVEQSASKAILTWETFNVGRETTLHFDQSRGKQSDGSNTWIALNRVVDPQARPSQILGKVKAEGSVYVLNRNGIVFGGASQVNTHSFLASSLSLFSEDVAASNKAFLNSGIKKFDGTVLGGDVNLDSQQALDNWRPPGDVEVRAGAQITTGANGFSLLAGPNVRNAGTILAKDGQAILAAGLGVRLDQFPTDVFPGVGHNIWRVGPAGVVKLNNSVLSGPVFGTVENTGMIGVSRGNASLVGYEVRQSGVVQATTSVSRTGSLYIAAIDPRDNAAGLDVRLGGILTFGSDSLTTILPERDGESTTSGAAADLTFKAPVATFAGTQVTLADNSLVVAPGAAIELLGLGNAPAAGDEKLAERIDIGRNAVVDVSGLADVRLAMSANQVTIPRVGQNELADSPLQRNGLLYREQVAVDARASGVRSDGVAWFGSPLLNIGGYVDNRPRLIDQLLTDGGSINVVGRELVTRAGSQLNLDGGYVHFLGGRVQTTRLLGRDGRVYDVSQADPYMTYEGIAGQHQRAYTRWNITQTYTDPLLSGKFGRYESDYIVGGRGGRLTIVTSATTLLGGDMSARAVSGRYQIDQGKPASGGSFRFGLDPTLLARAFDLNQRHVGSTHVFVASRTRAVPDDFSHEDRAEALPGSELDAGDTANPLYWTTISADRLRAGGFSNVSLGSSTRETVVERGAAIAVENGGSINLTGARVQVHGDLTARSGQISLSAGGFWEDSKGAPLDPATGLPARGDVIVAGSARLDVSGEWINDALLPIDQRSGAWINGGSISLTAHQLDVAVGATRQDWSGSVTLQPGAVLDASGGGRVLPNGQLAAKNGVPLGRGGDVSLLTYMRRSVDGVTVDQRFSAQYAPVNDAVGRLNMSGATILADSLGGGGTLSLRALNIQIGGDASSADPRTLYLASDFFSNRGFGAYDLSAELDATIAAGAEVRVTQRNLIPDVHELVQAPTGSRLFGGEYGQPGRLDDFHRPATNFSLRAGDYVGRAAGDPLPSVPGATGTLLMQQGSRLLLDAGASARLGSRNQLTVLGSIVAHGGDITLSADSVFNGPGESPPPATRNETLKRGYVTPSRSLWLGSEARLDVSGVSLIDPLAELAPTVDGVRTPRTGRVLGGGKVTLSADTGYVVVQQGAAINMSGAADRYDLVADGAVGSVLSQRDVWSNAGTLTLAAGAGMFFDGTISATRGAPQAEGGTLVIRPIGGGLDVPQLSTGILFHASGNMLAAGLAPGEVVEAGLDKPSGTLHFAAERLRDSGISTLVAGSNPKRTDNLTPLPIGFAGDVTLSLPRAIQLNASSFVALPEGARSVTESGAGGTVRLDAEYVSLSGLRAASASHKAPTDLPVPSDASLLVQAGTIDLGGQFSLANFGQAEFNARGDIRFYTPAENAYLPQNAQVQVGQLFTAGDLTFTAAQLYPTTNNSFAVVAAGAVDPATGERAETNITIRNNGHSAPKPLSAGGRLLFDATHIEQQGTIRAPAGQIVLGVHKPDDADVRKLFGNLPLAATKSVRLATGSVTSVSLDGLTVPYGVTIDQTNYQDRSNPYLTEYRDLAAPPEKQITVNGANVTLAEGATIDLSGGGELYAQEWIAGTGGSRDVLSRVNTVYSGDVKREVPLYQDGRAVYAIVPGQVNGISPYDPSFDRGDVHIGQAVYLSGRDGVPAGIYTLMPARYATLPGAYRVVQDTGVIDLPAGQNATLPDGTLRISGHFVDAVSGSHDARSTAFLVQSREVWGAYSEYATTNADTHFSKLATSRGVVAPQLARDAGRLALSASQSLAFGATLDTAAAKNGAGAQVDIASDRIQIVGSNTQALDGYLQLGAKDLSSLNAASLLIGGARSQNGNGVTIDAQTSSLVVANDANSVLSAPEIVLVTNGGAGAAGDGLYFQSGSVLRSEGAITPGTSVPITMGRDASADNTVPAISGNGALVRVSNGAPVLVNRRHVSGDGGLLQIDAGATLTSGNALSLDATGDTRLDPTAVLSASAIDANSSSVSLVTDAAAGAGLGGLVIGRETLAQLSAAKSVTLRSRGDMNFVGGVDVTLSHAALDLSAARFVGDGGDVHLAAKTLTFSNALNGSPSQNGVAGAGTLSIDAGTLQFGPGAARFAGFSNVAANATQMITGSGKGIADFGNATLSFTAPVFAAGSAAETNVTTTGAVHLAAAGAPASSAIPVGGALTLTGASIDGNPYLAAPAGRIALNATQGDLTLANGASLDVSGVARKFIDVSAYAPGGAIKLSAERGNVHVDQGAVLNFSGDKDGGSAGSLSLSAPLGSVQLDGAMRGNAAAGQVGGSFSLDVGNAVDLNVLADRLLAGGIDGAVAVETHSGNLELSSGHKLKARSVQLVADGGAGGSASSEGRIVIGGEIDASGQRGGDIGLFGKSGVTVQGTLRATGSSADKRGGTVRLYTSGVADGTYHAAYGYQNVTHAGSGRITIADGAVIDVSGGTAGGLSGGVVDIRAPLLNDGDVEVTIANNARIRGAREVGLEAYAVWSTTDATAGSQHFDGIVDPAGWYDSQGRLLPGTFTDRNGTVIGTTGDLSRDFFAPDAANPDHVGFYQTTLAGFVQQPGFAFENRFAHVDSFVARPGIELTNPSPVINGGKISVLTHWNLGATTPAGGYLYRYGSAAPKLTFRAEDDVEVKASITDGFYQYNDDELNPSVVVTRDAALDAYNRYGLEWLTGVYFETHAPGTLTTGTPAEQSLYYEMFQTYAALFGDPRYGASGTGTLSDAAFALNNFGQQPLPDPNNTPPAAPANLTDYAAYLAAYVAYATTALQTWTGDAFTPPDSLFAPAPPPLQLSPGGGSSVPRSGNSASPYTSYNDRVPIHSASLTGGGASYRLVAGADWTSVDPLALRGDADGDIRLEGHIVYTNRDGDRDVLLPTLIRTGTGSIDLAAARDIRLADAQAPGVIYTAGRPAAGTATTTRTELITSTHNSYRALLLATGAINPEAAGDIALSAGRDVIGNQELYDVDGRITGIAGNYIGQYWWPWMQTGNPNLVDGKLSAAFINFGAFGQGVMSVGGDIAVEAGRDIRQLSVSLPTTWNLTPTSAGAQSLAVHGGGDLTVAAGRDVLSGAYFVSRGSGSLSAGGRIGSDFDLSISYSPMVSASTPVATMVALQDADWNIFANQGVQLGGIYNPSYVRKDAAHGFFASADSQAYSTDSSLAILATSGDVALSTLWAPGTLFSYGSDMGNGQHAPETIMFDDVLPASLSAIALDGSLSVEAGGVLFPSAQGNLSLLAAHDLLLFSRRAALSPVNRVLVMSDANAEIMFPSPLQQYGPRFTAAPLTGMSLQPYEFMNLHRADPEPIRLYALEGDIVGGFAGALSTTLNSLTLQFPKPAFLHAGRDIVDLNFRGQNYLASDVTRIVAGRDIYYTIPNVLDEDGELGYRTDPELHIEIAGPGTLEVQAGRNLGPLTASPSPNTGIRTTGNANNSGLPYEGANINVRFGVAPGVATDAFVARYLDPSRREPGMPSYDRQLLAYMRTYFADHPGDAPQGGGDLTVSQAWAAFQQLPAYRRQLLAEQVFFDVLTQVGVDYNDPNSLHFEQYARGYQAISTMFPAELGYTRNSLEGGSNGAAAPVATGNLDMRGSTIQTRQGGDVSILGPGGRVLIGSSSAPPVILDSEGKVRVGPSEQGILTMERGSIGMFSDLSILLAQSRVFTEQGGDIVMWSSNGDINAGKGAKSSSEKAPIVYSCDADRYCRVNVSGLVTGAGIATLQTVPNAETGDAVLVAPRGTVDAGDAGIRVSGNLVVAAFSIANADNIQVQGNSVGVPSGVVNVGALSTASSAAAAAQQAADEIANRRVPERAASMISVEVVGLGRPSEAQMKKMRKD